MEQDIFYQKNRFPQSTVLHVGSADDDGVSEYDISCVSNFMSAETCLKTLHDISARTKKVILVNTATDDMREATKNFVAGKRYIAYRVDDITRIYVV
jgi:hypothetical protein